MLQSRTKCLQLLYRFYRVNRDLTRDGTIKAKILDQRLLFLFENGYLKDLKRFQNNLIFCNYYLYNPLDVDHDQRSNLERMQLGIAPISSVDKESLEIHHFDQRHSGILVVLTNSFHKKYTNELHSHCTLSETEKVQREIFNVQRRKFWQSEGKTVSNPSIITMPAKWR